MILLMPVAIVAQEIPSVQGLNIVNLNRRVSPDIDISWLDCALEVFPDVQYDDNGLTRSVPIRGLSANSKPITISRKMRLFKATDYWFEVDGELRLAMLFHLEEQYLPKAHLDVLAVYRFKPKFELIDAIDARFDDWQVDETQLIGGLTELETSFGGAIALINRRDISTNQEEKHRFLGLDADKLRVVFELPVLENKKSCVAGDVSHIVKIGRRRLPNPAEMVYELTVERNAKPITACQPSMKFGISEYKTFLLEWDAVRQAFKETVIGRGSSVIGAWGTYNPRVFASFPQAMPYVGKGYRAQALYNPQTGAVRLVAPGKYKPAESITFNFEDYWRHLPSESKRSVRGVIDFLIIWEETTFSADGGRKTEYECLIYAFSKRTRR